ncbi:hypothetical protein [Algoriphagus sp.]|uniref:hypothetical protein n=1 Tax=Algoriphagus sp. TaxID=1872435 RepID=UPI00391CCD41
MNKFIFGAVISTALFVWGCGSSEEKTASSEPASSWEFEKVDSLQFDIIGRPILADAEFGKILIYDETGREFILLDQKSGELINRFSKKGDSPDNFGNQVTLPGFLDEERIAIAGVPGIFVFNTNGELIRKHTHPEPQSGSAFISLPGNSIQWIDFQAKRQVFFKSLRTHDSFQGEKEFYTRFRAIEITDPETGTSREFISFRPESRFLNGLGWGMPDYEPIFTTDSKEVFVAFAGEPAIHSYKISGDSLVWMQSQNLELKDFGQIDGKPLESFSSITFSLNIYQAAIWKISLWKDKILVYYYAGLSTKELEETRVLHEQGRREEGIALRKKQMEGKSMKLLILEKSTLSPINHITLPENVNTMGFALDGDNFYFQKEPNPDLEEEFIRLYRYQLIEK